MALVGTGGPGDGQALVRRLRGDLIPTVRHELSGAEYVETDDGSYVPVVDSYRYITTTGS